MMKQGKPWGLHLPGAFARSHATCSPNTPLGTAAPRVLCCSPLPAQEERGAWGEEKKKSSGSHEPLHGHHVAMMLLVQAFP